jgi:hypothetical protein
MYITDLAVQKNLVHPTSVISNSLSIKTKICFTVVVHSLLLGTVRKDFLPYKTLNWMLKRWSDGPDSSVLNKYFESPFHFVTLWFFVSIGHKSHLHIRVKRQYNKELTEGNGLDLWNKKCLFFDFCVCLYFVNINNSQWLRNSLKVMRRRRLHGQRRSQRTLLF